MASQPPLSSAPKKILFVSHSSDLAGAERGLFELAQGLMAQGHAVRVVLPKEGPLAALLHATGIQTHIVPYRKWANTRKLGLRRLHRAFRQLRTASKLKDLFSQLTPDIVITNTIVIPAAAIAARRLHIPHVWYIREFGTIDHGMNFDLGFRLSMHVVDRLSDTIIVNCVALKDYFSEWIPSSKISVVYNAVDLGVSPQQLESWRAERSRDTQELHCTLIGRISPAKGQEDALRAISILKHSGIAARLTLVGPGESRECKRLESLASELEITDFVEFTGFSETPLRFFSQADVALVCSRFEAFGRVTVEALKCGCPVIGTSCGGTVEHIQDGTNGFTYQPGDVATLAAHLKRMATDPELRAQLAKNAASANQRYNLTKQVEEVDAHLTRILGRRS